MVPAHIQLETSTLRKVLKRLHWCACAGMLAERGVVVDHATVHRWALKILPVLAAVFRRRKRPVGSSWRVDET